MKRKGFIILTLVVLILTSLPAVFTAFEIHPGKFSVPVGPYGEGDYYYDRIKEIKDGHPFIGNPYFFEHREEIAPAFFLADWIAAVPTLVGLPLLPATMINFFIWSLITTLVIFLIFKKIGISDNWSVFGSILCYASVYVFMIRPVSMQIVFPFFFLFLLALFYWLDSPSGKKNILFLSITAAISAYLYSYTAQIILILYVVFAVYFWFIKDQNRLRELAISGGYFGLMIIPFVLFTVRQMSHPFYFETMKRIGLMDTHIPIALFFISGFFVVSGIICSLIFWFNRKKESKVQGVLPFFALFGFVLIGLSGSNIITGKELENAQHFERYMIPWLLMTTIILLWLVFREKKWQDLKKSAKVFFVLFFLVVIFADIRYFFTHSPVSSLKSNPKVLEDWRDAQMFKKPLEWIDDKEKDPVVIWTEPVNRLNSYVAMLSRHYSLFNMGGILHIVSDEESTERFMVAHYFDLTEDILKKDFKIYAGTGNAIHPYMTHNRKTKICRATFGRFWAICGEEKDAVSFTGQEYFERLYEKFNNEIKPDIDKYLLKYNVSYALRDKIAGTDFQPGELEGWIKVYDDGRFEIYHWLFAPSSF